MPWKNETLGPAITIFEKDPATGYVQMAASSNGAPSNVANQYMPGAMVIDTLNKIVYVNYGSTASPAFGTQTGGGVAGGTMLASVLGTGTTEASFFGSSGLPFAITIKSVWVISMDTTAGNVTLEAPASTVVATIAKGTTAGALVGASSLANTSVAAGVNIIADCSTAGVAMVFFTYVRA